jgi:hypothetical protein
MNKNLIISTIYLITGLIIILWIWLIVRNRELRYFKTIKWLIPLLWFIIIICCLVLPIIRTIFYSNDLGYIGSPLCMFILICNIILWISIILLFIGE